NAFKFTQQGGVWLKVTAANDGWTPDHPVLSQSPMVAAFEVSDSGIGIPQEKQKIIFEAFQQADASTSRKYGGTGLGLAISRELAHLLGGAMCLRTTPGMGSMFTLYLPLIYGGPSALRPVPSNGSGTLHEARTQMPTIIYERVGQPIPDDRMSIEPGAAVLLIVEDDPHYAGILIELAKEHGFKVLVASKGGDALALAQELRANASARRRRSPAQRGSRSMCFFPTCWAGPFSASSSKTP